LLFIYLFETKTNTDLLATCGRFEQNYQRLDQFPLFYTSLHKQSLRMIRHAVKTGNIYICIVIIVPYSTQEKHKCDGPRNLTRPHQKTVLTNECFVPL